MSERRRVICANVPSRIDAALDAMLRRLAVVVADFGDPRVADALRSLATSAEPTHCDGGVLDLPQGQLQPVDRLVCSLDPTPTERDLLILSLASHRNAEVAAVLRELHPEGRPWPTLGLAVELATRGLLAGVDSPAAVHTALATSRLLSSGIVELGDSGPWSERSLMPGALMWEALTGLDGWPPELTIDPLPNPVWGMDDWLDAEVTAAARSAIEKRSPSAFGAFSDRPDAVAARLAALVTVAGATPVVLRAASLTAPLVQLTLVLAVMRDVVPVLCETGEAHRPLELSVPHVALPLLVARRSPAITTWPRPLISIPVGALSRRDRMAALHAAAPGIGLDEAACPASAEPRDLHIAAGDLHGPFGIAYSTSPDAGRNAFVEAIDRRVADTVPPGAVLVHPTMSWSGLVLAEDRLTMLREAVSRAEIQAERQAHGALPPPRRGERGLRMLFCGAPGTGKTLAAEVIARALGRDLLVVSLSQLVSKWIGETEKNLEGVFEAAERGDTLLFFDEADALFGKRTEVGDARDRYANLETAYLLARIESFTGVVVLSTNLRRNIDSAFARRIEFIVPFDLPDAAARLRLWKLHLPTWVSLSDDVQLADLAELYDLPGALIRNAATAAGYLAAADGQPDRCQPPSITADHLVHAVQREHAKAGLAFPGAPRSLRSLTRTHTQHSRRSQP